MLRVIFLTLFAVALSTAQVWAADPRFEGRWKITHSIPAPWQDRIFPENPAVVGRTVNIGDDFVTLSDLAWVCDKSEFSVEDLGYDSIFEGGLSVNPKKSGEYFDKRHITNVAADLGFKSEPVPTLMASCTEIQGHLRDKDTILFALDNRIYTMKREAETGVIKKDISQ